MSHLPSKSKAKTVGIDELEFNTVTLSELENNYNLLHSNDNTILVAEKPSNGSVKLVSAEEVTNVDSAPGSEISGSSETMWRRAVMSDYNPNLSGMAGLEQYREMKNDAVVRASLRVAKTPILSARWFMQPASQDPADVEKSNFVWHNLTRWMSMSWPQFLVEALHMMDYGVYAFEKVFDVREWEGEQRIVWRKFAPRHPMQIEEFVYDEEGGPEVIKITTDRGTVDLPIQKALIFTFDKEGGDLWGHSILRSAYKHWFFKETLYKIDAIQKERHSIGIPIIKLPPNFTTEDKSIAQRIGTDLRTNESAHVVLPPNWDIMFLKLEGNKVDALESAQHHADKLYENVLANFLISGSAGRTTDADVQSHVFTRAVRFTAEVIRDVLNHYAIQQLLLLNWPEEEFENGFPELRVRRLGDERDWRVLSFAVRNLIGSGTIRPDDELEAWAREELDMPVADLTSTRYIVEEHLDPVEDYDPDPEPKPDESGMDNIARPPQQSQAGNMRQAQSPGSANSGRDGGGVSGTTGG